MTKFKKWILFSTLPILTLLLLHRVSSYSSASIRSPAIIKITDSENALIALPKVVNVNAVIDGNNVVSGNTAFNITNNMTDSILLTGITQNPDDIINLDYEDTPINPGEQKQIEVNVSGKDSVDVTYEFTWDGGSAEIKNKINVNAEAAVTTPAVTLLGLLPEELEENLNNLDELEPDKPIIEEIPVTQEPEGQITYPLGETIAEEVPTSQQAETPTDPQQAQLDEHTKEQDNQFKEPIQESTPSGEDSTHLPQGIVEEQPSSDPLPSGNETADSNGKEILPANEIIEDQSLSKVIQELSSSTQSQPEGDEVKDSSQQESTEAQGQ